jgi:hypothetical protein
LRSVEPFSKTRYFVPPVAEVTASQHAVRSTPSKAAPTEEKKCAMGAMRR